MLGGGGVWGGRVDFHTSTKIADFPHASCPLSCLDENQLNVTGQLACSFFKNNK